MAHVQQLIIDAVALALTSAAIVPSGRVFVDRVDSLTADELPCICVDEGDGETIELLSQELQTRTLRLSLKCVPAANATAAAARQLGLQAEQALQQSSALRASVNGFEITSSQYQQTGNTEHIFNLRLQAWSFICTAEAAAPNQFI